MIKSTQLECKTIKELKGCKKTLYEDEVIRNGGLEKARKDLKKVGDTNWEEVCRRHELKKMAKRNGGIESQTPLSLPLINY